MSVEDNMLLIKLNMFQLQLVMFKQVKLYDQVSQQVIPKLFDQMFQQVILRLFDQMFQQVILKLFDQMFQQAILQVKVIPTPLMCNMFMNNQEMVITIMHKITLMITMNTAEIMVRNDEFVFH
jgi:hypothetical protein